MKINAEIPLNRVIQEINYLQQEVDSRTEFIERNLLNPNIDSYVLETTMKQVEDFRARLTEASIRYDYMKQRRSGAPSRPYLDVSHVRALWGIVNVEEEEKQDVDYGVWDW